MIIGRFWRFARIGHAVYLLQESEELHGIAVSRPAAISLPCPIEPSD